MLPLCFVLMPPGLKVAADGTQIDFDARSQSPFPRKPNRPIQATPRSFNSEIGVGTIQVIRVDQLELFTILQYRYTPIR